MYELAAFIILSVKYEMQMGVHENERQHGDITVSADDDTDPVHAVDEVLVIVEQGINRIAVCAEVPAVGHGDSFSFSEMGIDAKVGFGLAKQDV